MDTLNKDELSVIVKKYDNKVIARTLLLFMK